MSDANNVQTQAPTMILEPEKWAKEMHALSIEYIGLPEQNIFLTASRRFSALAAALKIEQAKPVDGFVIGGDID